MNRKYIENLAEKFVEQMVSNLERGDVILYYKEQIDFDVYNKTNKLHIKMYGFYNNKMYLTVRSE